MAEKPTVGGDSGGWGDKLNAYLDVSHSADGTLKTTAVTTANVAGGMCMIADSTEFTTSSISTNVDSPDTMDFTSVIGSNRAFIIAMIKNHESGNRYFYWHPSGDGGGDTGSYWDYNSNVQNTSLYCETQNDWTIAFLITGTNGTIKCWSNYTNDFTIKFICYTLIQS